MFGMEVSKGVLISDDWVDGSGGFAFDGYRGLVGVEMSGRGGSRDFIRHDSRLGDVMEKGVVLPSLTDVMKLTRAKHKDLNLGSWKKLCSWESGDSL